MRLLLVQRMIFCAGLAKKNRMSGNTNFQYQGEGACQASGNSSRHVTYRGANYRHGQAYRPRKFNDFSSNQRDVYESENTSYPYQNEGAYQAYGNSSRHVTYRGANDRHGQAYRPRKFENFSSKQRDVHENENTTYTYQNEGAYQAYGTSSSSQEYDHMPYWRANDRYGQANKTRKYNEFPPNQRSVHVNTKKSKNSSLRQKAMQEFEFFWGSNFPYSQFYACEFTVDDITFNCTEQYMMYNKAMLFEDEEVAEMVLKENDPCQHKKLGRKVKNFDQKTWDANCSAIVERGNKAKFSQNEELKATILKTHPKTIVETSPHDKIWGIGLHKNDPLAWDRSTWKGLNLLGQALTKVRDELIEEENAGACY